MLQVSNLVSIFHLCSQFKKFHKEIIYELEKKTELDVKYMNVRTRFCCTCPGWRAPGEGNRVFREAALARWLSLRRASPRLSWRGSEYEGCSTPFKQPDRKTGATFTLQATLKRYQAEHRHRLDSLEKSQAELKKIRRKSQGGRNPFKYECKEIEVNLSALCYFILGWMVYTVNGRHAYLSQPILDPSDVLLLKVKNKHFDLVGAEGRRVPQS